jgi:hypothetical protein
VQTNVLDNTVLVWVVFQRPGLTRKGDLEEIDTSAEKDRLRLSKRIIECEEYEAICRIATQCRNYCRKKSVPSPFVRSNIFMVPLADVEAVCSRVEADKPRYKQAIEEFLAVYPAKVQEDKDTLQKQWKAEDYPEVSWLRTKFGVDMQVMEFALPGKGKIAAHVWDTEKAKADVMWANATVECQKALRVGFQTIITHMQSLLEPNVVGKKKRFTQKTVDKAITFLESFNSKNVTGDEALAELVRQAHDLLSGVEAKQLKKNAASMTAVTTGVDKICKQLSLLVENTPVRAINLEE